MSPGAAIRPLAPPDAPTVAALLTEALGGEHPEAGLLDRSPHTHRRVLVEGDAVIGFMEYRVVEDEAELCQIAVAPAARRRGLARRLLDQLFADVIDRGAEAIYLEVRMGNTPARALYAGAGFEHVGRRRRYYADGQDAALYRRDLRPTPDAIGRAPADRPPPDPRGARP